MASVFTREMGGDVETQREEGHVKMEALTEVLKPQAKECWQQLKARREAERIPPRPPKGTHSANTLVLISVRINFAILKTTAVVSNTHISGNLSLQS